jgi:hypothetical protein
MKIGIIEGLVIATAFVTAVIITGVLFYRAGQESVEKVLISEGLQRNAKLQKSLSDIEKGDDRPCLLSATGGGCVIRELSAAQKEELSLDAWMQRYTPSNNWGGEPSPVHRKNLDRAYWENWCRMMWGTPKSGPHFRQNAMDWSDHCTEAGEANGR